MNPHLTSHPKLILLSGKPVRGDREAAPVGIYDVIRDDLKAMSTVQPVDRIFMERTEFGYRGILYSHEQPHMFALNGNGFLSKPIEESGATMDYCAQLEDRERALTADVDAHRSDREQLEFNEEFANGSPDEPSMTAQVEDAPEFTLKTSGPMFDYVERLPDTYRKMLQGGARTSSVEKPNTGICGGGIVMNKAGKILLVKPTNGWGGYDWTFPKGYPSKKETRTADTAIREVHEETGYDVSVVRLIGRFTHNDGGTCDYYECSVDSTKPDDFDAKETEAIKWVSLTEALELLNDDVDVKILAQANNLMPTLLLKAGHTGTMIALHLPTKVAKQIAIPGGESAKSMHVTIAYLGKGLTEKQKKTAATIVRSFANTRSPIELTLGGVGRFSASATSEGKDVVYLSVDSPVLTALRPVLCRLLAMAGLQPSNAHGYSPHVTLAYIDKKKKTPLQRFEPLTMTIDSLSLTIADKQMSFPFRLAKALPRLSDDQREEKNKKVGAKPLKAGAKKVGATGKVRYGYPGEKGGDKDAQPQQGGAEGAPQGEGTANAKPQVLPHPDTPPPQPDQTPVAADHPAKPDPNDPRGPDPTTTQDPKHTVNIGELCAALNVNRSVLDQIVKRLGDRHKFTSFMMTHLKEFIEEHGLDGDYFGLLWDVLTGKVPEGQPTAKPKELAAKPPTGKQPAV